MPTTPIRCRLCHRILRDPAYQARGTGRICGGPIRTGRAAAAPVAVVPHLRGQRDMSGQLAFDLDDLDEEGDGL